MDVSPGNGVFRRAEVERGMSRDFGRPLRLVAAASALLLGAPSCAQQPGFSPQCLERIADAALDSVPTYTIAANWAGPLGLTPSSDPDAPPWASKQAGFQLPDGSMHALAFGSRQWTEALVLRAIPPANDPRATFFVIDRQGRLVRAARIEHRQLTMLDVRDRNVRDDFAAEMALWAPRFAELCR